MLSLKVALMFFGKTRVSGYARNGQANLERCEANR